MELIDKDKVVAEIEKKIKQYEKAFDSPSFASYEASLIAKGKYRKLLDILQFLDTLEVKEVDLEKEWREFLKDGDVGLKEIAIHFFELGIQLQFDKELVEEICSHLDDIKDTADRMTSGNFMHHRAAIKFSANVIEKVLGLIGLKAQKGE